jgi:hypothetical protein
MPIQNIDNDYQIFSVTDTLHQLVDKLTLTVNTLDDNIRQFDSSVSDLERVFHADSGLILADSDLVVYATNVTFNDSLDFTVNADNIFLTPVSEVLLHAPAVKLESPNGISLVEEEVEYGTLANNNGDLKILSASDTVILFDSTGTTFPKQLFLPLEGVGSPITEAKTVDGAITELHEEIEFNNDSVHSRVDALTSRVETLESTFSEYGVRIAALESDMSYFHSLNVENTQVQHGSRLDDIETRLGLIGA